jgi:hypothetical protein
MAEALGELRFANSDEACGEFQKRATRTWFKMGLWLNSVNER